MQWRLPSGEQARTAAVRGARQVRARAVPTWRQEGGARARTRGGRVGYRRSRAASGCVGQRGEKGCEIMLEFLEMIF